MRARTRLVLLSSSLLVLSCQGGVVPGGPIPNGQWDFTLTRSAYSRGTIAITAPGATIMLTKADEGSMISSTCQLTMSRLEIALTVAAGQGNGSVTWISQHQGTGCSAARLMLTRDLITTFTISRTVGNGTGLDNPEGTWEVKGTRARDVGKLTYTAGRFSGDFMMRSAYSFTGSIMERMVQGMDTNGAGLSGAQR